MNKIDGVKAGGAPALQEWNEPVFELQEAEQSPALGDDSQLGKQVEKICKESIRPIKNTGGARMEEPLKPISVKRELMPPTGGSNSPKPEQSKGPPGASNHTAPTA